MSQRIVEHLQQALQVEDQAGRGTQHGRVLDVAEELVNSIVWAIAELEKPAVVEVEYVERMEGDSGARRILEGVSVDGRMLSGVTGIRWEHEADDTPLLTLKIRNADVEIRQLPRGRA